MIRDFKIQDYEAAIALWKNSEFIGVSSDDDRDKIESFLMRNPGLSKVAVENGKVLATALCGHNGRRGLLFHVCVDSKYRRRGIGRKLEEACLASLKKEGIEKCHIFIVNGNETGKKFWQAAGWEKVENATVYSRFV